MTQPDTLHTRLRDEINRRLDNAQATHDDGGWESLARWLPSLAEYLNLNGPADAIRRYEGELETLQRHVAETFGDSQLPEMLDLDPDQPWCRTCRGNFWPCADLRSLAHRLGVSVDG